MLIINRLTPVKIVQSTGMKAYLLDYEGSQKIVVTHYLYAVFTLLKVIAYGQSLLTSDHHTYVCFF